jgi:hypothetical protein
MISRLCARNACKQATSRVAVRVKTDARISGSKLPVLPIGTLLKSDWLGRLAPPALDALVTEVNDDVLLAQFQADFSNVLFELPNGCLKRLRR